MTRASSWWRVAGASLAVSLGGWAGTLQPLDLKPFVGPSLFESSGVEWLLPHGRQVLDGTPFQIDGAILLYAPNGSQKAHAARTNVNDIPVGERFEKLHLLAGAQNSMGDGTVIARIRLNYADGTSAGLNVRYGEHVRNWFGPWHKADRALRDPSVREAWQAQCAPAAAGDNYVRLFHSVLTNPAPDKEVRALSLESAKRSAALMVAALTVGSGDAERLADTVSAPRNPFPDLRARSGEKVQGEGIVKTVEGRGVAGALVRLLGERAITANRFESSVSVPLAETRTDAEGRFTLPPLPDDRSYRLLIAADGFQPALYNGLDPKSDPIEVRLAAPGAEKKLGKYSVRGRLVGPEGQPVAWAMIEPNGVGTGMGTSWGGNHGFPDQVFSGTNGEFVLASDTLFTRLQLDIHTPGLAPANVWVPVTNSETVVSLGAGGLLRGWVMKEDKPLAGVRIGVSGAERNSEVYAGHYETTTHADGTFVFEHLPPLTSWYLYGIMASLKPYGSVPPRAVRTPAHGESSDLGDIVVGPGLHLAGQVQTHHGEPVPKGLKVRIGFETAWDSDSADVAADGKFKFEGLGKGQVDVSLDVRGWRLAGVNRSMDLWNPWRLTGLVEADKDDLLLVIEKGERDFNGSSMENGQLPSQDWPAARPLAGAERSGPVPILLAGKVVDDKTGEPVTRCKVVPGYKPPTMSMGAAAPKPLMNKLLEPFSKKAVPWNERPYWQYSLADSITNGEFSVEFLRLSSTPMLRVEAPGYLPAETEPSATNITGLVVRLKRGEGPNGVVLLPSGQPAEGATVFFAVSREQFSLTARSLSGYGRRPGVLTTGKNGRFTFPARAEGKRVFAAHAQGWCEESVERSGDNLKLRLEPWAALKGTLMNSNGTPAAGVTLALTRHNDWQSGEPIINIQGQVTTDAKGHFEFPDVLPGRVEIQRVIPMPPNGWTYALQTWLIVKAGITNELGTVTYDLPPPPPAFEALKQRFGL